MKIIDLLNKIANGEEVPKKIKVHDTEYHKCILKAGIDYKIYSDDFYYLSDDICKAGFSLNDEVEILEEEKKIPEKLPDIRFENGKFYLPINDKQMYILREIDKVFLDKINSIIDYLKSKGE